MVASPKALATGRTQRFVYWQNGYFNRRARAWNGSGGVVLFALFYALGYEVKGDECAN